ncbi:hypothetical protein BDN70DRAFT_874198 [Pholiota conissans]|uniref:DUF6699 domain-containing protein n=1 Tax=Pholiota conissans TaxID=109636 RepID=A0A9P6CWP6_9AGAR|nr:hypothetical protein BDN70DRAFT_874198 [Pholiota conissans]
MAWHGNSGWTPYGPPIDPRFAYSQPGYGHPHPQWYTPPDPYAQQPLQSPPATQPRSSKYPNLNPALAEDTTLIRFDIRQRPAKAIIPQAFQTTRSEFAMAAPTRHIRLISKAFPWSIDIISEANITCEDIWRGLHNGLQINLVDSEWGFLMREKGQLETIENSVKKRLAADTKADKRPKRIDILGDMTLFRGLEKDDEFAKLRLLPMERKCDETWVVKLHS